jgi:leucyl aminopeptidase
MSYTTIEAFVRNEEAGNATTLIVVNKASLAGVVGTLGDLAQRCCTANGFNGEAGQFIGLPADEAGGPVMLAGCNPDDGIHALASLPHRLPEADYRLDLRGVSLDPDQLALGWALGAYRYSRYRKSSRKAARLVLDDAVRDRIADIIEATYLLRDLVNTPTQELGPADLAGVVRALAERFGADYHEWVGDDLLRNNYPTIHAVGRAASAARAPRLAMLRHGPKDAPHLVLVGKGVCFDTGGLDLKTADGMRWMKKDMGGAAHAIALAQLVLAAQLPVQLTLLIPAVENAVSADAFRPGEVIETRGGISVEIDNTDAEGRLILCDALAHRRRTVARSDPGFRHPDRCGPGCPRCRPARPVLQPRRDRQCPVASRHENPGSALAHAPVASLPDLARIARG